jgi:hypothetical protein
MHEKLEGKMNPRKFRLFTVLLLVALVSSAFTSIPRAVSAPTPKSPVGIITDTTPTYKWTVVTGADKYQFEVYRGTTKLFSKAVDPATCGTTTCSYTHTTVLKYAIHKWRVKVVVGGVASPWSAYKSFTVTRVPMNFNSQFNGSMAGWATKGSIAWHVNATNLYTHSEAYKCTNVYWTKSQAYTNFDYSARVKHPAGTPDYNIIYLAVRMGTNLLSGYNCWTPGYIFGYLDSGYISIWRSDSNGDFTPLYDSTYTDAIKKNGWNVLRVVANGPDFEFYINGTKVATVHDNKYKQGFVGIRTWTEGVVTSDFLVDWAKLTILP